MKDIRVKIHVSNNLLLSAIEKAGYKSQTEFAKECGLKASVINDLVSMRKSPIRANNGQFSSVAVKIMETLCCEPYELWSEKQLTLKLERNTTVREMGLENIKNLMENNPFLLGSDDILLEDKLHKDKLPKIINEYFHILTPREKLIINKRFGLNGEIPSTLEEIGKSLNICGQRVRQIEKKALRKLRNPERIGKLIDYKE